MDQANRRRHRRRHFGLLLLLALGFALRAGWGLTRASSMQALKQLPDQREYLDLARHLLGKGSHSPPFTAGLHFFDPRFGQNVYAYRMPGYPLFLAACGANIHAARLAQAAIDTSTALAVYLLVLALWKDPVDRALGALLAAAMVAFNPYLIFFSSLLLTETLFTAMLAWGTLLLIVGPRGARLAALDSDDAPVPRRGRGTLLWLLGGLVLAYSTLVRPEGAPLALLMGLAAIFLNRPRHLSYERYPNSRKRLGPPRLLRWPLPVGTTMLLLTVLVLTPWAWRNQRVLGSWIWTTTNAGITAYDGFNPDATGASDQTVLRGMMAHLRQLNEVQRSAYLGQLAAQYVRRHPAQCAELAVRKAGRTWSPIPLSREYEDTLHRVVGLVWAAPFDLLVILGLLWGGLGRGTKLFLLLPAAYFTTVHMLSVGSLRYRTPAEPLLAVIASAAIVSMYSQWSAARARVEETEVADPEAAV